MFKNLVLSFFLGSVIFISLVLYNFNPVTSRWYPLCIFRSLTKFDCPGCGALRATHQILHGNFIAAFKFNPLFTLALPFLLYSCGSLVARDYIKLPLPAIFIKPVFIWFLLGIIIGFGIFRNTLLYPFH